MHTRKLEFHFHTFCTALPFKFEGRNLNGDNVFYNKPVSGQVMVALSFFRKEVLVFIVWKHVLEQPLSLYALANGQVQYEENISQRETLAGARHTSLRVTWAGAITFWADTYEPIRFLNIRNFILLIRNKLEIKTNFDLITIIGICKLCILQKSHRWFKTYD